MFDHNINTKTVFTVYFKQEDVAVNLSRQDLVNLIKESVELLELSGEKPYLFEKESSRLNSANLN